MNVPPKNKPSRIKYKNCKPVLIVDDTLGNRELFAMQVREYGLPARHAETGKQAVDILAAEPDAFSLVMMDLSMPDMDGFRVAGELKTMPFPPLVILLSVHGDPASRERGYQVGCNAYVDKGQGWPALLEAMQKVLA